MSKREAEIIKKLVEVSQGEVQVFPATVKEVDLTTKACTVETATGLELYNVRLKATMDESSDFMIAVPKVDSSVLVGLVNNDLHALYLVQVSEPEQLLLNMGETKLEVDANGIVVNDGTKGGIVTGELLENKLNELVSAIDTELAKISTSGSSIGLAYKYPLPNKLYKFKRKDFEDDKFKH